MHAKLRLKFQNKTKNIAFVTFSSQVDNIFFPQFLEKPKIQVCLDFCDLAFLPFT